MKNISLILGLMAIAATSSNVNAMNGYEGTIDAGAIFVGASEYANDKALHSISIPASVEQIGANAFRYSGLRSVRFENNSQLAVIHPEAFAECHNLNAITLPGSIQEIGDKAFIGTTINNLTIESGNDSCVIKEEAFAMTDLTQLNIRKNVSIIENGAFKINNIQNVNLTGVSSIGIVSFGMGQALQSVSLHSCNNLTINEAAFLSCDNLASFTISGTIESIHPNAFGYFNPGQYAPITNFTIFGAEDARIRNQLIAAGIRPEAIHFE